MSTVDFSYKPQISGRPAFEVMDIYVNSDLIAGVEPPRQQPVRVLLASSTVLSKFHVVGLDDNKNLAAATAAGAAASKMIGAGNAAITFTAQKQGVAGNSIAIVILAPATVGVVSVSGTTITITPSNTANTALAVAAQVNAHGDASQLVTAVAGGDGSGATSVTASTALLGGATKITPIGVLEHAVTSSTNNTTIMGEVVLTGCYNVGDDDAGTGSPLVWDASFTTAALKIASVVGSPLLMFRRRKVI